MSFEELIAEYKAGKFPRNKYALLSCIIRKEYDKAVIDGYIPYSLHTTLEDVVVYKRQQEKADYHIFRIYDLEINRFISEKGFYEKE